MTIRSNTEQLCQRLDRALAKADAVLGLSPGELAKAASRGCHEYDRATRLREALAKADAALRAPEDTSARIATLERQLDHLRSIERLQVMSRPTHPPFILRRLN